MSRRRELALLIGALLLFTLLAALRAARHPVPFYDDVGYLHTGNEIARLGGPAALVRALYQGTFGEANRHPLYLALLSLIAGTDAAYHLRAQALTIATGVLA